MDILRTHEDKLHIVAKELMEKEKINGARFRYLMSDDYKPEEIAEDVSEEITAEISSENMELTSSAQTTDKAAETAEKAPETTEEN